MPPRVDGCPLEDNQCAACQLALSASTSFWQVNLCEKDLNGGTVISHDTSIDILDSSTTMTRSYSLAQVSYVLEMCEDTFKVICHRCSTTLSRADFRDHSCQQ